MRSRAVIALFAIAIAGAAVAADPPRPVGMVETVANAPAAKLQRFDYLYPGARIDLRPAGYLSVAWFDSCVVETFTGGEVRLEKARSRVSGGRSERRERPCPTAALKLAPSRSEAGVAIKRLTPFDERAWRELTLKSARPTFVWPAGAGEATVVVSHLDARPKTEIWRGTSPATSLDYPANAPRLVTGAPYEVRVERAGSPVLATVFSIDPDLEAEGSAASVAPLGL